MSFEIENFKFSPDILKLSGGNFKAFLKERYGKELKAKELKQIHDKFYGTLDVEHGDDNTGAKDVSGIIEPEND